MKTLLITLILALSLHAGLQERTQRDFDNLTPKQLQVLKYVYNKAKAFGLEHTLVAIAWQESDFGKYTINLGDPSCGIFSIMPKYLIKRTDLRNNSWNRSRLCERLIADPDFSFSAALLEFKYWKNYWISKKVARPWAHAVASYNQGFNANTNSDYVKKIKAKIKVLKKYYKTFERKKVNGLF